MSLLQDPFHLSRFFLSPSSHSCEKSASLQSPPRVSNRILCFSMSFLYLWCVDVWSDLGKSQTSIAFLKAMSNFVCFHLIVLFLPCADTERVTHDGQTVLLYVKLLFSSMRHEWKFGRGSTETCVQNLCDKFAPPPPQLCPCRPGEECQATKNMCDTSVGVIATSGARVPTLWLSGPCCLSIHLRGQSQINPRLSCICVSILSMRELLSPLPTLNTLVQSLRPQLLFPSLGCRGTAIHRKHPSTARARHSPRKSSPTACRPRRASSWPWHISWAAPSGCCESLKPQLLLPC